MFHGRAKLYTAAFLSLVAGIVVYGWISIGIPYYRNPPQPPYDQPPLVEVPVLMQTCTGCGGLIFLAFGVAFYASKRRRK